MVLCPVSLSGGEAFWTLRDLQTHPSAAMQCSLQHQTELSSLKCNFGNCTTYLARALYTTARLRILPDQTLQAGLVQQDGPYNVNIF